MDSGDARGGRVSSGGVGGGDGAAAGLVAGRGWNAADGARCGDRKLAAGWLGGAGRGPEPGEGTGCDADSRTVGGVGSAVWRRAGVSPAPALGEAGTVCRDCLRSAADRFRAAVNGVAAALAAKDPIRLRVF